MADTVSTVKDADPKPTVTSCEGGSSRGEGRGRGTAHSDGKDRGTGRSRHRGSGRGRGRGRGRGNGHEQTAPVVRQGTNEVRHVDGTNGVNRDHQPNPNSTTTPSVSLDEYAGQGGEGNGYGTNDVSYRLPPLIPASGPPIDLEGSIGGLGMLDPPNDPRLRAVYLGFPISVHPLRVPNARAHFSTATTYSIIDFRFLRFSGLLHQMSPLREGVDKVELTLPSGQMADVFGWVDVIFDAQGYEFIQRCWVLKLDAPVDIQLGLDWAAAYKVGIDWTRGGPMGIGIEWADAKRVRDLQDIYIVV